MNKSISKLSICVFIILILIISVASYINFENTYQREKRRWQTTGIWGPIYIYNGTRYPYKDFSEVFINEENDKFELNFKISFEGYSDTIFIEHSKYSKSDNPFPPDNIINNSGIYRIKDIVIEPHRKYGEYPYDVFSYNISLWGINDTYGKPLLNYLKYNFSSDDWNIVIKGEWNGLFFTFSRTTEISYYETLKTMCLIVLIIGLFAILFLPICYNNCKNKKVYEIFFKVLNAIVIFEISWFAISIILEYFLFQINNHLSSQYVQNLILIWGFMIFLSVFFIIYSSNYSPDKFK